MVGLGFRLRAICYHLDLEGLPKAFVLNVWSPSGVQLGDDGNLGGEAWLKECHLGDATEGDILFLDTPAFSAVGRYMNSSAPPHILWHDVQPCVRPKE